jgi:hypothetical protein
MSNDHVSGLALIVGSSGMIITMSLHPTGHVAPDQLESMIPMLIAVHALALACVPLMFLGALGLSRHVAGRGHLALTGLIAYTFALLAVMNAAVADGLVTPSVLRQMVASAGAPQAVDLWRMISHYNFYVNQGYAQVFVVASSVAIILWSASTWRGKELPRGLSIYGCILGAITLIALFSGHLNLDKHGFGIIIFGQAGWFIVAGALLLRREDRVATAAP